MNLLRRRENCRCATLAITIELFAGFPSHRTIPFWDRLCALEAGLKGRLRFALCRTRWIAALTVAGAIAIFAVANHLQQ